MKIISNSSKFIADEIKEPSVKHKNINKTDLVEVSLLNYTALNIYYRSFTIDVFSSNS